MPTYTTTSREALWRPWERGLVAIGIKYDNLDHISTYSSGDSPEPAHANPYRATYFTVATNSADTRPPHFVPETIRLKVYLTKSGGITPLDWSLSAQVRYVSYTSPNGFDAAYANPSTSIFTYSTHSTNSNFGANLSATLTLSKQGASASWLETPLGGARSGDLLDGGGTGQAYTLYAVWISWSAAAGGTVSLATGSSTLNAIHRSPDGLAPWTVVGNNATALMTLSGIHGNSWGMYGYIPEGPFKLDGTSRAEVTDTYGTGGTVPGTIAQHGGFSKTRISMNFLVPLSIPENWHDFEQILYENVAMDHPMSYSMWDARRGYVVTHSLHVQNVNYTLERKRPVRFHIEGLSGEFVGEGE